MTNNSDNSKYCCLPILIIFGGIFFIGLLIISPFLTICIALFLIILYYLYYLDNNKKKIKSSIPIVPNKIISSTELIKTEVNQVNIIDFSEATTQIGEKQDSTIQKKTQSTSTNQGVRFFLNDIETESKSKTFERSNLSITLSSSSEYPNKQEWEDVVSAHKDENNSIIVPISSLAPLISIEKRLRLTPTQSKMLLLTANKIGYMIIPDQKIMGTPFKWDDLVVLAPLPDKETSTSENYPAVAFILELGMSIALADGNFCPEERNHLDRFIFSDFELTSFDIECLKLYKQFLIKKPPSLEKLGARLKKHVPSYKKITIAQFLCDMAFADGIFYQSEYRALNKIFKEMGFEEGDIQALYPPNFTLEPTESLIQITKSTPKNLGESIKKPISNKPFFVLDHNLIREKLNNTSEAKLILNSVIKYEEDELIDNYGVNDEVNDNYQSSIYPSSPIKKELSKIIFSGLNPKYSTVLSEVFVENTISKNELDKMFRSYGLMFDGSIEEINTWSEENYGDILFDLTDEEFVLIDSEIKLRIQEGIY